VAAGSYFILAVAEILLAPFGPSLVTQLAPRTNKAQTIALWFAAVAVGNLLAGAVGLLWGRISPCGYFALIALLSFGAAAVLCTKINRLTRYI
jgi:proton-dependent oligopeptide transporter, POT family